MHIILAFVAIILLLGYCAPVSKTKTPVHAFSQIDAMQICRASFKAVLFDPEKAKIPFRSPQSQAMGFLFVWGYGDMRVQNRLGLEVPTSAVCWVMPDKSVRSLKIGDQEFIIDGKVQG
jgi:hypothetical protein